MLIQHYKALGATTSRAICDVIWNDYYFYASRTNLMLEIGYFSHYVLNSVCLLSLLKRTMGKMLFCGNVLYFKL